MSRLSRLNPRTLQILPAGDPSLVLPDSRDNPALEVWRDGDGRACAYGYVSGGRCWVHFLGVGTSSFRSRGTIVKAVPCLDVSAPIVEETYVRFILPVALQAGGVEVLHASAVLGPRGLIAVCGGSGAGKSTIAYGLARRGHTPWADDAVAFSARGRRVQAIPLPFVRRLRRDAVAHFRETLAPYARGSALAPTRQCEPFAALFVVDRERSPRDGRVVEARQLTADEVFTTILPHCQYFSLHDRPRKQRMVRQYLRLSSAIPVFELRFRRGLARLSAVLDLIEKKTASAPARNERTTAAAQMSA